MKSERFHGDDVTKTARTLATLQTCWFLIRYFKEDLTKSVQVTLVATLETCWFFIRCFKDEQMLSGLNIFPHERTHDLAMEPITSAGILHGVNIKATLNIRACLVVISHKTLNCSNFLDKHKHMYRCVTARLSIMVTSGSMPAPIQDTKNDAPCPFQLIIRSCCIEAIHVDNRAHKHM